MQLPHNCRIVNIYRVVDSGLYAHLVAPNGRLIYSGPLSYIVQLLEGAEFVRAEEVVGF